MLVLNLDKSSDRMPGDWRVLWISPEEKVKRASNECKITLVRYIFSSLSSHSFFCLICSFHCSIVQLKCPSVSLSLILIWCDSFFISISPWRRPLGRKCYLGHSTFIKHLFLHSALYFQKFVYHHQYNELSPPPSFPPKKKL